MTNQKIFEMLADNEQRLFYAYNATKTESLRIAHETAKKALETFARETGCHN